MTSPALDLQRFGLACLLGAGLGLYYGFLRPLRPRWTLLSDILFLIGAIWAWLYLGFAVCRGDIRMGYVAGLFVGGFAWELTVGKCLRPVFRKFWNLLGKIIDVFLFPVKKFLKLPGKIAKFLLATAKKGGTIKCDKKHHFR